MCKLLQKGEHLLRSTSLPQHKLEHFDLHSRNIVLEKGSHLLIAHLPAFSNNWMNLGS